MINLAFSKRLGATSSANILLDTSKAKTTSTPLLFTVFKAVPIFGFTKPIMSNVSPKLNTIIFKTALNTDFSGLNFFNKSLSANFFRVRFCHHKTLKYPTQIIGRMASK